MDLEKNTNGRIFHPYWLWEDHKHGFYENASENDRQERTPEVVAFFSNPNLVREYMERIIHEWKYSCEHNLTHKALNKIAYLGQCSTCLFCGVPANLTKRAWWDVPDEFRDIADKIAGETISKWNKENDYA